MPRINVLTGETPPPTIEPPPKSRSRKKRPAKTATPPSESPLLAAIADLPDSIFAFMTANPDCDVKPIRAAFREWAGNHPEHADWRKAWEPFWKLHGPKFAPQPEPEPGAEKAAVAFDARVAPLLTRAFPKALRRVLGAHGDLPAFDAAISGRDNFHCRYEREGYQPLIIEILPPSMCPAGVPAVSVCHTFIQNGDVMRDPEIVFAVADPAAWLAYEITQDPVGLYRCAYQRSGSSARGENDGSLYPQIVRDINGLVSVWARNLIAQGWCKPPPKPHTEIGPNVGEMIEAAVAASDSPPAKCLAEFVVRHAQSSGSFPKIIQMPQPISDPVAALLAEINSTTLRVKH